MVSMHWLVIRWTLLMVRLSRTSDFCGMGRRRTPSKSSATGDSIGVTVAKMVWHLSQQHLLGQMCCENELGTMHKYKLQIIVIMCPAKWIMALWWRWLYRHSTGQLTIDLSRRYVYWRIFWCCWHGNKKGVQLVKNLFCSNCICTFHFGECHLKWSWL